jgi:DNA-binding transcriptional LysR family regulator
VGAGVALIPRLAQPLEYPGMVIRPISGQRAARNIFAAVRSGAQDDPVVSATLEALREVAGRIAQ